MADGKVTIQCLADTTKFDEQMAKLEKRIDDAEKNKQLKFSASQKAVRELETYKQKIFELEQEFEKLSAQKEKNDAIMNKKAQGAMLTPEEFTEIQNFKNVSTTYEKMSNQLDRMYTKQEGLNAKVQKTAFEYEKADSKVKDLKRDLDKIDVKKAQTGIASFSKGLDNVGKSIKNQIRNVGRWALAILGIRGAITALRQASSIIGQYDEQYASNLEYIRYALAMSVKPILEYIVGLLARALQYVNYIASAWFGITGGIFKSADAFKNAKNNLGSMAKSAKEINKSLSSFDEVNKLQDNSSAGAGSGAGAELVGPSIDVSKMQGEVPSWIDWIVKNKDAILAVLSGIATALLLIKLGMSGIKALGFGVMVAGIVYAIESLVKYMKDPSWMNFGNIIKGIGVALLGLSLIIGSVPVAVAGAIALILGLIVSNWDKIKNTLDKGIEWLKSKIDWVGEYFGTFGKMIYKQIINIAEFLVNEWDTVFTAWKNILDGVIEFFKGVFTGNWEQAWEGLKKIGTAVLDALKRHFENFWNFFSNMFENMRSTASEVFNTIAEVVKTAINFMIRGINSFISGINNIRIDIPEWSPVHGGESIGFNIPQIQYLKTGGIINMPNKGVYVGGQARGGESGRERCYSANRPTGHG